MEFNVPIAVALCTISFGVASYSLSKMFGEYFKGIAQNPQAKDAMGSFLVPAALIESTAILGLLVALLILFSH